MKKRIRQKTHDDIIRWHARKNRDVLLARELLEVEPFLKGLLAEVALKNGLMIEDVLPAGKTGLVTKSLNEFYYRALSETLASTILLGHATARDHTTVMYGAARWAQAHNLPAARGGSLDVRFRRTNPQNGEAVTHG